MAQPPEPLDRLYSYTNAGRKILLLENLHPTGVQNFIDEGYMVETSLKSMTEEELIAKIPEVHIIGIRSKTHLTAKVLSHAKNLLGIGCFCIGTNQVDLGAARALGIPVFNSPYANSRSVAELIIGQIITLARHLGDRNMELHKGEWHKVAKGSREIRGKTLGIVGYGHIGTQLSVLAEGLGLRVIFYDTVPKLSLGNAVACDFETLLATSDYISLHVPQLASTKNLITKTQIDQMKPGCILLNASRGNVCDLDDVAAAVKSGQLGGVYVDVFPVEPKGNGPGFVTPLQGLPNVTLSPHIGGSTEEAQEGIGNEVSNKLIKFIKSGCSMESVNFPNVDLPYQGEDVHRILNVHKNVPGVLKAINAILENVNVRSQSLSTKDDIGYIMINLDSQVAVDIKIKIAALETSLRTRIVI